MNYRGVIIEESLGDKSVLDQVNILSTKVEKVTPKHKTSYLTQWTLHTVEIPYADFKNNRYHFIIYSNKIFKVDRNNPVLYKDAKDYGISIGIPDYQVDFAPDDKVWER